MDSADVFLAGVIGSIVVGAACGIGIALFKPDPHAFEVARNEATYRCVEVLPYKFDVDVSLCATAAECNQICAAERNKGE